MRRKSMRWETFQGKNTWPPSGGDLFLHVLLLFPDYFWTILGWVLFYRLHVILLHISIMCAVHLLQFDLILHFFVEVFHIVQLALMSCISFVCLIIYKCRRSSGFSRGVSKYRGVARSSIISIHMFDLQGMFRIDFQHLSNYCNLAMLSLLHSFLRWMLNNRQFQVSSSKFALQ